MDENNFINEFAYYWRMCEQYCPSEVCKLLSKGTYTLKQISKKTGVSIQCISRIKHGRSWKLVSDQYNIKNKSLNSPKFDDNKHESSSTIHESGVPLQSRL